MTMDVMRRFIEQSIGCFYFADDDAKQRLLPGRSWGRLFVQAFTESWSVVHAVLISFSWRSDTNRQNPEGQKSAVRDETTPI